MVVTLSFGFWYNRNGSRLLNSFSLYIGANLSLWPLRLVTLTFEVASFDQQIWWIEIAYLLIENIYVFICFYSFIYLLFVYLFVIYLFVCLLFIYCLFKQLNHLDRKFRLPSTRISSNVKYFIESLVLAFVFKDAYCFQISLEISFWRNILLKAYYLVRCGYILFAFIQCYC